MAATFGVGTPTSYAQQFVPWGLSPWSQGLTTPNPYGVQSSPYGVQSSLHQVLQMLQVVPQQLQHLQQLEYAQQQQLQQLQQILQIIPAQLMQLQQLVQLVPQQIQQTQQLSPFQQPFSQIPGLSTFAATPPSGIAPQIFGAQPNLVM